MLSHVWCGITCISVAGSYRWSVYSLAKVARNTKTLTAIVMSIPTSFTAIISGKTGWIPSMPCPICWVLTLSFYSFGSTSRQIWLDNVRCSGTESRLVSCSRNQYGSQNCDHSKDVAIYCNTPRSNTGSDINSNTGSGVHLSGIYNFMLQV